MRREINLLRRDFSVGRRDDEESEGKLLRHHSCGGEGSCLLERKGFKVEIKVKCD